MKPRSVTGLCAFVLLWTACGAPGTHVVDPEGKQERSEAIALPSTAVSDVTAPEGEARERALLEALRATVTEPQRREGLRVFFAFHDLNGDGDHEAVVHLRGPAFCGTGGCTTMVYQWDPSATGYTKTHHIPTTRPPIYASRHEGCPWSTLWVQRSGGGRRAELHAPNPLSDVDSCDAPAGVWSEAKSQLLIPPYDSRSEGTAL